MYITYNRVLHLLYRTFRYICLTCTHITSINVCQQFNYILIKSGKSFDAQNVVLTGSNDCINIDVLSN